MFSGNFGVLTAAEVQVDAEIAAAQAAFKAGLQISQIEPWRDRLARCSLPVQQMLEIDSLLAVDDEESVELELAEPRGEERPYDEERQIAIRIGLYSLQAEVEEEISYIPSTEIL